MSRSDEDFEDLFRQLKNVLEGEGSHGAAAATSLQGAPYVDQSQVSQQRTGSHGATTASLLPDVSRIYLPPQDLQSPDGPPAKMRRPNLHATPLFNKEQEDLIMSRCHSSLAVTKINNIINGDDLKELVCKSREGSSNLFTAEEFTSMARGASSSDKLKTIIAVLKNIVHHKEPFERLLKDSKCRDGYFNHQTIAKFLSAAEIYKAGDCNKRAEVLSIFCTFVKEFAAQDAKSAKILLQTFEDDISKDEFFRKHDKPEYKEFVIGVIDRFFSKSKLNPETKKLVEKTKESIFHVRIDAPSSSAPAPSVMSPSHSRAAGDRSGFAPTKSS